MISDEDPHFSNNYDDFSNENSNFFKKVDLKIFSFF